MGEKGEWVPAELRVAAGLGADEGGLEALELQREEEGGCKLQMREWWMGWVFGWEGK